MFDNVADPYQTNNLVDLPAHASLRAELAAQLDRKLASRNDEFLPGPHYIQKWGYTVDANGTVPYAN